MAFLLDLVLRFTDRFNNHGPNCSEVWWHVRWFGRADQSGCSTGKADRCPGQLGGGGGIGHGQEH